MVTLLRQLLGLTRMPIRDALWRLKTALLESVLVGQLARADEPFVFLPLVVVLVGALHPSLAERL